MRITIQYEASWRNSFLDGSNNEPLPKNGRGFIGSMTNLLKRDNDKYSNFIKRELSIDTIMGVLNRLIGDQRKLYQSRQSPSYYFLDIEKNVTFDDIQNKSKPVNAEIVYIRNITGSTDQNSFTGMIKGNDPIFNAVYSDALWGVLTLEFDELCRFINDQNFVVNNTVKYDPLSVLTLLERLNGLKATEVIDDVEKTLSTLNSHFSDAAYLDNKGMIKPIMFYCSALYLQIARLSNSHDLTAILTKSGGLSGISKRGFTPKDFMDKFTTGNKKPIWGNPYILKKRSKGEGEVISMLTKANGTLEINLNIPTDKAKELKEIIDAAGVSSFYLGKKGLAYVDSIRT